MHNREAVFREDLSYGANAAKAKRSATKNLSPRQRPFSPKHSARIAVTALHHQRGWSVVELMVAAALSVIVSSSAVAMLSNTMASNSRIMHSSRLSHDLRASMQLMSRDVRRAGYTEGAMWCLAGNVCLPNANINLPVGSALPLVTTIQAPGGILINDDNDCFTFELDRNQDGSVTDDEHGAYRRSLNGGIGVMQMWTGSGAPDCSSASADWMDISYPRLVDITSFSVDDDLSVEQEVATDLLGNSVTQRVRRIRLQISGAVVNDAQIAEQLESVIDVRNDIML